MTEEPQDADIFRLFGDQAGELIAGFRDSFSNEQLDGSGEWGRIKGGYPRGGVGGVQSGGMRNAETENKQEQANEREMDTHRLGGGFIQNEVPR